MYNYGHATTHYSTLNTYTEVEMFFLENDKLVKVPK